MVGIHFRGQSETYTYGGLACSIKHTQKNEIAWIILFGLIMKCSWFYAVIKAPIKGIVATQER